MKRLSVNFMSTKLTIVLVFLNVVSSQRWPYRQQAEFRMRLQPEVDAINIEEYIKNDRLFNYQMKCVLFDGFCDIVGRWFVPRMPELLVGRCPKCTPTQAAKLPAILDYVKTEKQEVFDLLYQKYVFKDKWEEEGNQTIDKIINGTS